MFDRVARAYIQVLLTAETMLLMASVAGHLLVLTGRGTLYEKYLGALGTAVIVLGGPTLPFRKKPVGLIMQIKSCPQWMWKSAAALAIYGIMTLIPLLISPTSGLFTSSLVSSAFPFGFEAIPICILYSALWRFRLGGPDLMNSTLISIMFMILGIAWVLTNQHLIPFR